MSKWMAVLGGVHSTLYKATGGRLGGKLVGATVLLLKHRGRKSGKARTTPLVTLEDEGTWVIAASKGGADKHPAWYLNLMAAPDDVRIVLGKEEIPVRAEDVKGEERDALYARMIEMYSGYDGYQKKTERRIPVIRLVRR